MGTEKIAFVFFAAEQNGSVGAPQQRIVIGGVELFIQRDRNRADADHGQQSHDEIVGILADNADMRALQAVRKQRRTQRGHVAAKLINTVNDVLAPAALHHAVTTGVSGRNAVKQIADAVQRTAAVSDGARGVQLIDIAVDVGNQRQRLLHNASSNSSSTVASG